MDRPDSLARTEVDADETGLEVETFIYQHINQEPYEGLDMSLHLNSFLEGSDLNMLEQFMLYPLNDSA